MNISLFILLYISFIPWIFTHISQWLKCNIFISPLLFHSKSFYKSWIIFNKLSIIFCKFKYCFHCSSGTDEQQNERKDLLSQKVELKTEADRKKKEKDAEKKKSVEDESAKAKLIRKRAMEARSHEGKFSIAFRPLFFVGVFPFTTP